MQDLHLTVVIKNIDGGTGTFLRQILKIGKPFKKISVIALSKPKFKTLKNIDVTYFRYKNYNGVPNGRISAAKIFLREFLFLAKTLKASNSDIVLAIDTHCNILISLVKLTTNIRSKLTLTFHNNNSGVFHYKHNLFPVWLIRITGNILFRTASCIIGVSRGVSKDVRENFKPAIPVHTIHYGLDLDRVNKLLNKKIDNNGNRIFKLKIPTVLTVSRLAGQKDVKTLLNASIKLFSRGVEHKLIIAGDGDERKQFLKIISKNKLENKISLLGWKQNIFPYLKRSDIFVLSTHYEGFPFVLLEAMSAQIPIVATNIDYGPSELLGNNKFGLLVKHEDANDLADKIELLINKPELRKEFQKKSKVRIKQFTEENMLKKYNKIITSILTIN